MSNRLQRRTAGIVLAVVVATFALQLFLFFGSTQDDAFISYRYARNFAEGRGLVYNAGERVEGYSSFLWTVILGLTVKVGGDPVRAAPWLGALAATALLAVLVLSKVEEPASTRSTDGATGELSAEGASHTFVAAGLAAAVFYMAGSSVAAEAVAGLETPLFALLVMGALLLDAREREGCDRVRRSGWLYALAALTRAEGLAVFAVAALVRLAELVATRIPRPASTRESSGGAAVAVAAVDRQAVRTEGRSGTAWNSAALRAELLWSARVLVPVALHCLFRWLYYQDLVPNLAHAKVTFTAAVLARGVRYSGEFLNAYLPVIVLAAIGLAHERRSARARLIAAWAVFHLAWVACVGGDYKPTFRLFAPVIPPLCLMAGAGLVHLCRAGMGPGTRRLSLSRVSLGTGAVAFAAAFLWVASSAAREFTTARRHDLPVQEAAGRWLASHFPKDTLLATSNAGCLPYYSGLPTIDMLGGCDRTIALRVPAAGAPRVPGHEAGNAAYVLSRRPDVVLFMLSRFTPTPAPEEGVGQRLFEGSEIELWQSEEFHRRYRWTSASLPGFVFNYYEKGGTEGETGGRNGS